MATLHLVHKLEPAVDDGRQIRIAQRTRLIGVTMLALSFSRWPLTVLLAAPGWGTQPYHWYAIFALQVCAEAMFWTGLWLVGGGWWRAALLRTVQFRPIRALVGRPVQPSPPV
ncbi:MAG TPA: hypothetical protein VMK05_09260 [Burkholderiales bacterium]|nr:hypothetical protein [Burkholderiales bacterium]